MNQQSKQVLGVVAIVCIILAIVGFIVWRTSPYWPWPTDAEISDRLEEVIDMCDDNESSSECKKLKRLYNMTFKYCVKVKESDYGFQGMNWTFNPKYEGIYGVAWEGDSTSPPQDNSSPYSGLGIGYGYRYILCRDHSEDTYLELVKAEYRALQYK